MRGCLFWLTDKDNFYRGRSSRPTASSRSRARCTARSRRRRPCRGPRPSPEARRRCEEHAAGHARGTDRHACASTTPRSRAFAARRPEGPSHVGLVAASAPGTTTDTWQLSDLKVTNVRAGRGGCQAADDKISTGTVAASARLRRRQGSLRGPLHVARSDLGAEGCAAQDRLGRSGAEPGAGHAHVPLEPRLRVRRRRRLRHRALGQAHDGSDHELCRADVLGRGQPQLLSGGPRAQRLLHGGARRRRQGRRTKRPVDWVKLDEAKTGAKEKNTLRVTAKGDHVAISVNGKQVADFKGEPPKAPSYIGMLAASAPSKSGDDWSITDFKVTAPQ